MDETPRETTSTPTAAGKTIRPRRRFFRWIGIGLVSILLGVLGWDVATFDRDAWLRDFEGLEIAMAREYGNLDWMVEHRGTDLAKLDRDTRAALGSSFTRVQAFLALRRFVRTFRDPHFKLTRNKYLATCEQAFTAGMDENALKLAVRAKRQESLQTAIRSLHDRGAKRLLVDLTGNGGGTEWVSEAVPLFTGSTLQRNGARIVSPTCDRTPMWKGERVCSIFSDPPETTTLTGAGAWRGPLFILADRGTGSASEDFVAWFKDNHAATILGDRTAGAGCGYMNGGGRFQLRAAGFEVRMPNCARFLADGTNEVEGITPDKTLPLDKTDEEKITALQAALHSAPP